MSKPETPNEFVDPLIYELDDACDDAGTSGIPYIDWASTNAIQPLIGTAAQFLAGVPDLKCGVFITDEGLTQFTIQSLKTNRRCTFTGGTNREHAAVSALFLDENNETTVRAGIYPYDAVAIQEHCEWVLGKDVR